MQDKAMVSFILSAGITNRSYLEQVVGNDVAQNIMAASIPYLSTIAEQHRGVLLKNSDETDSVVFLFKNVQNAIEAGKTMQLDLDLIYVSKNPKYSPPCLGIGIDCISTDIEKETPAEDAVKIAQCLMNEAQERQMLITEVVKEYLDPSIAALTQLIEGERFEKNGEHLKVYEIAWDLEALQSASSGPVDGNQQELRTCLELRINNMTFEVDQGKPVLSIGRQPHNHIVIREQPVSRTHACIKYRDDQFYLIDESSNGTFVQIEGEKMKHVIKSEIKLSGSGVIGIGKKAFAHLPGTIHFNIQYREFGR